MYEPTADYEASLTDENKSDWVNLKNRATDLEKQYREAVGEDNEAALKEVGLLTIGELVNENFEGDQGPEVADQERAENRQEGNEDVEEEAAAVDEDFYEEKKPHARVRIGGEQASSEMERVRTGASRTSMESAAWSVPGSEAHIVNGGDMGSRNAEGTSLRGDGEQSSRAGIAWNGGEARIVVGGSNMGLPKKNKVIKSKAAKSSMRAIERCVACGL